MTELTFFRPILCMKTVGFLNKKMTWEHCVLREWTFFWQIVDMRALCFSQNGRFFTKNGQEIRAMIFFMTNRKKWASYWPFWRIVEYSLTVFAFFGSIMCMTKGWKFWRKKTCLEHRIFERTFFWQNMGMRATCFLETGRYFHKIWGREQWFLVKSREKKKTLLTFLTHNLQ